MYHLNHVKWFLRVRFGVHNSLLSKIERKYYLIFFFVNEKKSDNNVAETLLYHKQNINWTFNTFSKIKQNKGTTRKSIESMERF